MSDVLVRPVWNALAHRLAHASIGGDRARRFAPDIGWLASARDDAPESLQELAALVPPSGTLLLLQADPIVIPSGTVATMTADAVQMVSARLVEVSSDAPIERMTADDPPRCSSSRC